MKSVLLGLGSNLGDSKASISNAINKLQATPYITIKKCSPLYKSSPVGDTHQPWFYNCVLAIETFLNPKSLLEKCLSIEKELLRTRTRHWGPRTIDIDVLDYEGITSADPELTLPHPRMHERLFVLKPLQDILPDFQVNKTSLQELISNIGPQQQLHRLPLIEGDYYCDY